jgi:hypothetical protein
MRAAALQASVPGAMTASVRTDGVPNEAKGALSSWRDGPRRLDDRQRPRRLGHGLLTE